MSSFDENEQLISKLEKEEADVVPSFTGIKSEYINITGKQAPLFNRALEENTTVQNGRICIKFTEPVWVYDITLWLEDKDQAKSDKLLRHTTATVKFARGGESVIAMAAYSSYIDCYPRDFLTEIEIKFFGINKISLSSPPACKKLSINGLSADEFHDFCQSAGSYNRKSKELKDAKSKLIEELRENNTKISEAQETLLELSSSIEEAKEAQSIEVVNLNNAQLKVSSAETKLSILNAQSSELEQRISENNRSIQNLASTIQDHREELDTLLADRNVFMEEFKSYVEQGQGNIKTYLAIGVFLFAILCTCLWRLIESALKISEDPHLLATINAFDLFLSRLPLAFVLGMIIIMCMRTISKLLTKIFEIHQERLLLSKLSILAKDNSFSSAEGIAVDPEVIYSKRVSLKMELLKEFLSGNYKGAAAKEKELRSSFEEFRQKLKKSEEDKKNEETEDV